MDFLSGARFQILCVVRNAFPKSQKRKSRHLPWICACVKEWNWDRPKRQAVSFKPTSNAFWESKGSMEHNTCFHPTTKQKSRENIPRAMAVWKRRHGVRCVINIFFNWTRISMSRSISGKETCVCVRRHTSKYFIGHWLSTLRKYGLQMSSIHGFNSPVLYIRKITHTTLTAECLGWWEAWTAGFATKQRMYAIENES